MATKESTAKGATAHTAADGHGKASFPPFQANTFASQLVSFAIAFALLYFIVSKFALPRVGGIIANARARAQAIGSETRDKLSAQAESDRKALETSLTAKLADAEKTIATTRATAMGNVRSIASDAAAAIVQRLTGVAPDSKTVDSAVDASLKG